MDCKRHEEGLATLAEGGEAPEAARHVAECPACGTRLEGLRRMVAAARVPAFAAPADLVARAQALMRPAAPRRLIARLLGNGLAASGARRGGAEDFALHVGTDDVSVRLQYAPTKGGWEILGRAPGEGWSVAGTPCGPSGRFRLLVPSLEESAFVLRSTEVEIEVPSARRLLDDGL